MHALGDVDVLELSQFVAGPNCGQLLAALGADVVKLEPPEGEPARTNVFDQFAAYNLGGKESVALDLRTEGGREVARDLAAAADVVVENFAPGVLSRFDLDYESVAEDNGDVVYCSISGFGEGGPYSDYPGIDHLMQPMSGLMANLGYPECPNLHGEEYLFGTNLIVDLCTGVHAALLIAAALRRRDRTGEGEFLDVALYDTALSFVGTWIAEYTAGEDVPRRDATGGDFARTTVPLGVFEAEGGPIFVAAVNDRMFERLCRVLDRPDLAADGRFADREGRADHEELLREEIGKAIAGRDRDDLFEALAGEGVIAGPFRDVPEVVEEDPHVEARDMLAETFDPRTGEAVLTATVPFRTGSGHPDPAPPPRLGEDTRAVLSRHGYPDGRIEELIESGAVEAGDR